MNGIKAVLFASLIGIGILIGFGYGRWYGPRPGGAAVAVKVEPKGYHCPMHPNYRSDKPGECGICGMRLVPDEAEDHSQHAHSAAASDRKILYYRDPEQPSYRSDKPGLNPETGNDLEPVYETMPMGTIRVSPEKQQLIGVRFGTAETTAGTHTFRAAGKVMMDETRVAKVQTKIAGWIDRVFVDFTGKLVEKDQPLLTIYSPEMLASQQEYLLALRGKELMKASPLAGSVEQSESMLKAARKRLELWDLSDGQIEQITRTGEPLKNITVLSPIGGYVMARNAFPKQRITPETELYTVADLSRVWVMADVFETDAASIRTGMAVHVTAPYSASRAVAGRVDYIQPQIDPVTRTLKVRIELDNPGLAFKPDMFVDAEFRIGMPARVTVPQEAVLNSGLRKTVFVDRGNGYLEPREVQTGGRAGDRVEITSGLRAGERIVVSGNFLIDSESQLKAAASGMTGHQHGAPAAEHKHD
jgi:membrane fusion protein, copper/silver efflux system